MRGEGGELQKLRSCRSAAQTRNAQKGSHADQPRRGRSHPKKKCPSLFRSFLLDHSFFPFSRFFLIFSFLFDTPLSSSSDSFYANRLTHFSSWDMYYVSMKSRGDFNQ